MYEMQKNLLSDVRETLAATRKHLDYVNDFKRRAQKDPKGCANEAVREIEFGARNLPGVFEKAFGVSFEEAFDSTFYLTPERRFAMKPRAPLPKNPEEREWFLLLLHWLHFHRLTLNYFIRCISAPGGPHVGHARDICACFVRHQEASWFAYLMVADDIAKAFPDEARCEELIKAFAAYFVAHISLHANKRLRKVINDLKGQDEKQFERLVIEVATEVVRTWREKREGWSGRLFDQDDLLEIRTGITRTIENSLTPPRAADLTDLAAFADKEKLLQLAKTAGLTPQEMQVFRLWIEDPALKNRELGERLGISAGHVGVIKHRIKNSLDVA